MIMEGFKKMSDDDSAKAIEELRENIKLMNKVYKPERGNQMNDDKIDIKDFIGIVFSAMEGCDAKHFEISGALDFIKTSLTMDIIKAATVAADKATEGALK